MKVHKHRKKYHKFYQDIAALAARQSVATRRKVGAVIVSNSGMIATGWNGTAPGFDNVCELHGTTREVVIHAERNAIDKMTLEGISTKGAILFTTTSPCLECAKSIAAVGIKEVYFNTAYSDDNGIVYLKMADVKVRKYNV